MVTEDTGTQGKGGWQLEVNAEVSRDSTDGIGTRGFRPAATLSYGVADAVDVQVGRPYQRLITDNDSTRQESNGGLDTALDLKWRFFENEGFSLGLKPGVTFATGRHEASRGTGRTTLGTLLVASWDQATYALHGHLGVRRNSNAVNERRTLYQAAGAAILKVTESIRAIIDLSVTANPDRADSSSVRYVTAGAIYSPQKNIDLDLGGRKGFGKPATDRALMFGATLRW